MNAKQKKILSKILLPVIIVCAPCVFSKPDYYKLPRSIDKKNIEQENKEEAMDMFYSQPLIDSNLVNVIQPIISKWTDFYSIDLTQARLEYCIENACIKCSPNLEEQGMYYKEFNKKLDTDRRKDVDYSSNKQWYVDLGIGAGTYYNEEDKKYYFIGWDDCQEIYLINRTQKYQTMIIWLGAGALAEGVFWQSNDMFVVVGYDHNSRFVKIFDISNQTISYYQIKTAEAFEYPDYMGKVYLKEKGIIVSN